MNFPGFMFCRRALALAVGQWEDLGVGLLQEPDLLARDVPDVRDHEVRPEYPELVEPLHVPRPVRPQAAVAVRVYPRVVLVGELLLLLQQLVGAVLVEPDREPNPDQVVLLPVPVPVEFLVLRHGLLRRLEHVVGDRGGRVGPVTRGARDGSPDPDLLHGLGDAVHVVVIGPDVREARDSAADLLDERSERPCLCLRLCERALIRIGETAPALGGPGAHEAAVVEEPPREVEGVVAVVVEQPGGH